MSMLNIGGENAGDAFYRYKMPKMVARIEGRGNGIKTNVVNNVEIAKALERPPEYVLKWFGCELGAQTKFDKKSGTSIVNGAHDAAALAEKLEGFIKKYVQCYSCGNPETVVKIKRENILLKCKACGFVSEVDATLKLNTFILKNPPDTKLSKAEKKVKKAEKERLAGLEVEAPPSDDKDKKKKKKSSKSKKGEDGGDEAAAEGAAGEDEEEEEEDDDDDVEWMTDTSAAAMQARAAEQLSAATAALVTQGNVEAEREAQRQREQKRAAAEAAEAAEAAAKAEAEASAARLAEEARQLALSTPSGKVKELVAGDAGPEEVAAAVRDVEGGPAVRMQALYEGLFGDVGEGERLSAAVASRAAYLAPHASDAAGQLAQLVAMEHLLAVTLPGRVKEAPLVLKVLYDEDLAAEQLIEAWHAKVGAGAVLEVPEAAAAAVRAAAQPFVDWLQEAASEEDSEEEEEEE